MKTRDRTKDYIQIRQANRNRNRFADKSLVEEVDNRVINVTPLWIGKLHDVRTILQTINERISKLESLHRQRLLINFEKNRNEEKEELDIKYMWNAINKLFENARNKADELKKDFKEASPQENELTYIESRIFCNINKYLANHLLKLEESFKSMIKKYEDKLNQQTEFPKRGEESIRRSVRDELARDVMIDMYRQSGMSQIEINEIMMNRQMIDERVRDIEYISSAIKTLNNIHKQLEHLLIEQGTVLDRIDVNMQITQERVSKGKHELEKATEYENASCFKYCILFLLAIIIVLFIADAIKLGIK